LAEPHERLLSSSCDKPYQSGGLTINGQPETDRLGAVSANYFRLLKATPALGRTFNAGKDVPGRSHVMMILSYPLWGQPFCF